MIYLPLGQILFEFAEESVEHGARQSILSYRGQSTFAYRSRSVCAADYKHVIGARPRVALSHTLKLKEST